LNQANCNTFILTRTGERCSNMGMLSWGKWLKDCNSVILNCFRRKD
jgi:hypothetical protein